MKRLILYSLLTIGFAYARAVPTYEFGAPAIEAFQSHQMMHGGTRYQGTVYQPFSSTTPSEQYMSGNSETPKKRPGNPKTFIGGPDQTGPSPVGEPWVLAAFAILFAGLIALKKKKKLEI